MIGLLIIVCVAAWLVVRSTTTDTTKNPAVERAKSQLDSLQTAAQAAPRDPTKQYELGVAQLTAGDYSAADASFGRAIELDNATASYHVSRGMAQRHLGQYEKAASSYTRAIELAPSLTTAYVNLATIQETNLHDQSAALATYTRGVQAFGKSATASDVVIGKASLEKRMGRVGDAQTTLRQFLDTNDDPRVRAVYDGIKQGAPQ